MIQHVALEVTRADAPACAAFYELLGFTKVAPPESLRDRATWLERDGTQVHLLYLEEPQALPAGHFAVIVEAYPAALGRLRAAGHDVDPRREHWGSPRAYVRDPAGNLVELMQFPPR